MGNKESSIENVIQRSFGICLNVKQYIDTNSFNEKYRIGGIIGTGQFAEVYYCNEKSTNNSYAMKIIYSTDEIPISRIVEEVEIMKLLRDHPNIVSIVDSNIGHINEDKYEVKMVLELCKGGDLYQYILSN
ncbi:calcium-dependent protein kinase 7(CDPK7), partial [Cryptosporidium felis]